MGAGEHGLKRLIVTGDDFGLSLAVNEAVEAAHQNGILTTTCLMVAAPEAADAVARAERLAGLAVGLHIVLVRGRPTLPPAEIPALVGSDGLLHGNLFAAGLRFFFSGAARRHLASEIRAQFDAFHATGLALDHVNAHNHMHLHPTVLGLILKIGRDYGLGAVRLPLEPDGGGIAALLLKPWVWLMKSRLKREQVRCNDYLFGMRHTGSMDRDRLLPVLHTLPDGVSEILCHPATGSWQGAEKQAASFRFADELNALVDSDVRSALEQSGARLIAFRDI